MMPFGGRGITRAGFDRIGRLVRKNAPIGDPAATAISGPLAAFGVAGGDARLIGAILPLAQQLAELEFDPQPKQVALELEQLLVFGEKLPFARPSSNDVIGLG